MKIYPKNKISNQSIDREVKKLKAQKPPKEEWEEEYQREQKQNEQRKINRINQQSLLRAIENLKEPLIESPNQTSTPFKSLIKSYYNSYLNLDSDCTTRFKTGWKPNYKFNQRLKARSNKEIEEHQRIQSIIDKFTGKEVVSN